MFLVPMSASGVFFFQAEDGIRDLVRSRGLGDVYKRQVVRQEVRERVHARFAEAHAEAARGLEGPGDVVEPVSYTHLTLPTSDLV